MDSMRLRPPKTTFSSARALQQTKGAYPVGEPLLVIVGGRRLESVDGEVSR